MFGEGEGVGGLDGGARDWDGGEMEVGDCFMLDWMQGMGV